MVSNHQLGTSGQISAQQRWLRRSLTSSLHHLKSAWSLLRAHHHLHHSRFPRFSQCSHVFSAELSSAAFNCRWTRAFCTDCSRFHFLRSPAEGAPASTRGLWCSQWKRESCFVWNLAPHDDVRLQRSSNETLLRGSQGECGGSATHRDASQKACGRETHFPAALLVRFVALLLVSVFKFNLKHIWSCGGTMGSPVAGRR